MKKLDKDLSKIFFNSVEEMNEYYGIDAELPSKLYSNTDLVCYEIVEPLVYEYVLQYNLTEKGFYHLEVHGEPATYGFNWIKSESQIVLNDLHKYEGRCFVYVRVNEYLRKHVEKTLIGCEFVFCHNKTDTPYRRFIQSVEYRTSGIVVTDQDGLSGYLDKQLFYTDDHSDPIHYKEWIKKINEQDVDVEG
jgi:hypothetical protein